jgi:4-amino-4-deoxy-L-arabinose transferase-like glycosyltransferase
MNLNSDNAISLALNKYLPLSLIVTAYSMLLYMDHAVLPIRPDELWYVVNVEYPEKSLKLFFRFFNFYTAKLIHPFSSNALYAAAFTSYLYSVGIIVLSYLIVRRTTNQTAAILSAIIVCTYPTLIYQATWFGSDMACLFFGLMAVYFSMLTYLRKDTFLAGLIGSGFFLIASIFTKQSGIVFIIPVLLFFLPKLKSFEYKYFFYGVILALLFLSVNNAIWLDDFFYHLNPYNYIDFLSRFDVQITKDIVSKPKWSPVFYQRINSYFPWVMGYVVAIICLFSLFYNKENKHYFVALCIALVGILSFSVHEAFHVKFPGLNIHERYMLTMIIPLLITFPILVPFQNKFTENAAKGLFSLNIIISILFIIMLFVLRTPTFYNDLNHTWGFYNSFVNVFSFWFFLAGIGLMLFGADINNQSKNLVWRNTSVIVGLCIIILFSSLWGNILAEYDTWRRVEGKVIAYTKLMKIHNNNKNTFMFYDIDKTRTMRGYFTYAYLNNVINREQYTETLNNTQITNISFSDMIELIKNNKVTHILTKLNEDEIVQKGELLNLSIRKIGSLSGNYLYQVKIKSK